MELYELVDENQLLIAVIHLDLRNLNNDYDLRYRVIRFYIIYLQFAYIYTRKFDAI